MCDPRLTLERGEGADLTTPLHRRDRQASLARPFAAARREVRRGAGVVRGCRLGSQRDHGACSTPTGTCAANGRSSTGGAGLSAMTAWLMSLTTGRAGDVGVALETPRGPVVESLTERGFRGPRDQREAARPLSGRLLAGGREGSRGCAGSGLRVADRPALPSAAGIDRAADR